MIKKFNSCSCMYLGGKPILGIILSSIDGLSFQHDVETWATGSLGGTRLEFGSIDLAVDLGDF